MLPHTAQTILEVGCGNGYLTLELARDGHDVTGIDLSADIIEVAERSKAAHLAPPGFGSLGYLCTDVNTWQAPEATFDAVIFNRALHHMHDLHQTMAHEHSFAWVPYLFVYIGNGIRHVTPEQERELLTFLKRMEQYLIEHEALQAVGFRYVGGL